MVGNFFDHATLPVAASIATTSPAPLVGSNELAWNAVDVYCAGRSSTAANTMPSPAAIGVSTPPSGPGPTVTGLPVGPARRGSFSRTPTGVDHSSLPLAGSNATTTPALPDPITSAG